MASLFCFAVMQLGPPCQPCVMTSASNPTGRLLLVIGAPASGKTTVGRMIAAAGRATLLDKDTIFEPLVESLLAAQVLGTSRREGPEYEAIVKEGEYIGLLRTAAENRALGNDVVVCAPFTAKARHPEAWRAVLEEAGGPTGAHAIWVRSDAGTLVDNMGARRGPDGRPLARDVEALAHREAFLTRIDLERPPGHWVRHLEIDNRAVNQDKMSSRLSQILKEVQWPNSIGPTKSSRRSATHRLR